MNNKINQKFLEYIYYIKILNYLYNQKLIDNNTLEKIKYNLSKLHIG